MIYQTFHYTKKNGEQSDRHVFVMNEKQTYLDAIDLDKLDEDDKTELEKIQLQYENDMKKFTSKAFRRFSYEGMSNIEKENKSLNS